MQEHFQAIKEAYDSFYRSLLSQGRLLTMDTGIGQWGVSVSEEVFELFKRMKLDRTTHLIDLGHGDGKVALIASLFTNASGVEYHPWLYQQSLRVQKKLSHVPGVKGARLLQGDFMKHKLDSYDTIFMFPDNKFSPGLQQKLINEFSGKLIVQGGLYLPNLLEEHQEHEINGTKFHEFRL